MARGEVAALLKIADFHQDYAYNIRHLKQIRTLALPISSFLDDVNTIATLRARLEHEAENKKLVELANTLFLYREIALGMFHQVTNHINRVESELMLIASILAADKHQTEAGVHVSKARDVVREAKELIRKAQQRGRSLTPIRQECQLVEEIVRPALKYIEHDHPEVNLRHSLTSNDYLVEVDPGYMKEGLYNLLNNAIWAVKHNRGGKREIFVAVRSVEGRMVRILVEDSGVGIESEFRPSLFKPFATTRADGTGLGLYFAQQLVEHFGGRLELERSQPNRGSVFVITLPLKEH
jgi:signal transduction histidine kinase